MLCKERVDGDSDDALMNKTILRITSAADADGDDNVLLMLMVLMVASRVCAKHSLSRRCSNE